LIKRIKIGSFFPGDLVLKWDARKEDVWIKHGKLITSGVDLSRS
jgi:hypothetical protein